MCCSTPRAFADYGKLSGRSLDDMIAGARVEVAPYKRHPADFVLWKPSKPGEPVWDSPWGPGRPGWHIECSAMIEKTLGLPIDIHGGGHDLIFPHHENEIAQCRCADHAPVLAPYWVHNGFLTMDAEKMSKSLGNVKLVHELVKRTARRGPALGAAGRPLPRAARLDRRPDRPEPRTRWIGSMGCCGVRAILPSDHHASCWRPSRRPCWTTSTPPARPPSCSPWPRRWRRA